MRLLRVGTRASALALAQSAWVAERLPVDAELVTITTAGDVRPGVGDKGRWVGALEQALLDGHIDLAVHSAKDVPGDVADGCEIVAAPTRASAGDVLVGVGSLDELPAGARVGTSALRRRSQLLATRPDLEVRELRGNVDTRLGKLAAGDVDALILARAGLERLDPPSLPPLCDLDGPLFVPAPGQGILALEAREGDESTREVAAGVNDPSAFAELQAERAAVRVLDASCNTPVGIRARALGGRLQVRGYVGLPDGSAWLVDESDSLSGAQLGERMLSAGARDLLDRAEAMAA